MRLDGSFDRYGTLGRGGEKSKLEKVARGGGGEAATGISGTLLFPPRSEG